MKIIGNIIWLIFGGLEIAIEYFVASVLLMITIVGIPFGLQTIKLGILALWPFGSHVQATPDHDGCLDIFMNILWFFIAGVWIWISHILLAYCTLHYHHRNPVWKDALPPVPPCAEPFWERSHLTPSRSKAAFFTRQRHLRPLSEQSAKTNIPCKEITTRRPSYLFLIFFSMIRLLSKVRRMRQKMMIKKSLQTPQKTGPCFKKVCPRSEIREL
jgi:hypothetical protein